MYLLCVHFPGETFQRARRLKEKMLTNLVMAKDRLDVLGILLCKSGDGKRPAGCIRYFVV